MTINLVWLLLVFYGPLTILNIRLVDIFILFIIRCRSLQRGDSPCDSDQEIDSNDDCPFTDRIRQSLSFQLLT